MWRRMCIRMHKSGFLLNWPVKLKHLYSLVEWFL
ncbi:MAG: hypothetical protein ACI9C4_003281, partial [Paraglaciecola sp.]